MVPATKFFKTSVGGVGGVEKKYEHPPEPSKTAILAADRDFGGGVVADWRIPEEGFLDWRSVSRCARLEGGVRSPSDPGDLPIITTITMGGDDDFGWTGGCASVGGFDRGDQHGGENRRHHPDGVPGRVDGSWHHVSWVIEGLATFGRSRRARFLVGVDAGAFSGTAQGSLACQGGGESNVEPPGRWITSGHHHRGEDDNYRGCQESYQGSERR